LDRFDESVSLQEGVRNAWLPDNPSCSEDLFAGIGPLPKAGANSLIHRSKEKPIRRRQSNEGFARLQEPLTSFAEALQNLVHVRVLRGGYQPGMRNGIAVARPRQFQLGKATRIDCAARNRRAPELPDRFTPSRAA
jgi:hypothetical protein